MEFKNIYGINWNVNSKNNISKADLDFIINHNFVIYWSDLKCKNYSLDTKLPSGKWLENIFYSNDLKNANAIIL